MSGVGGPAPCAVALIELPLELYSDPAVERLDTGAAERVAIARRIGAIVAQCQKEAREGVVPLKSIELRLALLAEDVRGGIHGATG